jgi:hypothetical protein
MPELEMNIYRINSLNAREMDNFQETASSSRRQWSVTLPLKKRCRYAEVQQCVEFKVSCPGWSVAVDHKSFPTEGSGSTCHVIELQT